MVNIIRLDDDQIDQMHAVAEPREAFVLNELAQRAGLRWVCSCEEINPSSSQHCERCSKERER